MNDYDGSIVIKTKLDLEDFEKSIEKLDKTQIDDKKVKISADLEELKKQRTEIAKEIEKYEEQISQMSSGVLREKVLTLPEFQEASAEISKLKPQLETVATSITINEMKLKAINKRISETPELQEEVKQKVEETTEAINSSTEAIKQETQVQEELNKKVNEYNGKRTEINVEKTNDGFKKLGNTIKSISLTALTVAISAVASLFGKAVEQSEVAKGRMEAIKQTINGYINMLAAKLEPLVLKILDLIEELLPIIMQIGDVLLDYVIPVVETLVDSLMWAIDKIVWIINNVGGVNTGLIKDNTKEYKEFADNTEKVNKNTQKTNKELSKLKKQLMGFDEMNVLNDSGGTGILGGSKDKSKSKEKEAAEFTETLLEAVGVYSDEVLKLRDKFKKNGFTKTFAELLSGTKEENEKKVNEIKPVIMDFFNGVATTRQNAITQFLKTPWINSFFGSNSDIDNKTTKITNANNTVKTSMDSVATKSKTDANIGL